MDVSGLLVGEGILNKIYAVRFSNGSWAQGSYWKSTNLIENAKLYGKIGTARQSLSYHGKNPLWQNAEIIEIEVYPGGNEEIESLKKFYRVDTITELVNVQNYHIERLQAKLNNSIPWN